MDFKQLTTIQLLLICLLFSSLMGSWGWKKQENCDATAMFANVEAPFKFYSKDDYCVIVDIRESIDRNGPPTTFRWEISDGSTHQGSRFEHCFSNSGKYDVTLLATSTLNRMSLVDSSYYKINISDFAIIEPNKTESYHTYLSAEKTVLGINDKIKGYYWDFGDGQYDCSTTSFQTSHQYDKSGEYNIRLIVVGETPSGKKVKLYSQKTISITQ